MRGFFPHKSENLFAFCLAQKPDIYQVGNFAIPPTLMSSRLYQAYTSMWFLFNHCRCNFLNFSLLHGLFWYFFEMSKVYQFGYFLYTYLMLYLKLSFEELIFRKSKTTESAETGNPCLVSRFTVGHSFFMK